MNTVLSRVMPFELRSPVFFFHTALITGPMYFEGRCGSWNGRPPDAVSLLIGDRVVRCRRTPCEEAADGKTFRFDALFSTSGGFMWVRVRACYGDTVKNFGSYLVYNRYPAQPKIATAPADPVVATYLPPSDMVVPSNALPAARIAVVLHLFYCDLWPEFSRLLANIREPFDLYVTVCEGFDPATVDSVVGEFPRSRVMLVSNRGRDILPFLDVLRVLPLDAYRYVCKVHSKKSPHRRDGGHPWRNALLGDLLGSEEIVASRVAALEADPALGLVAPWDNLCAYSALPGCNKAMVATLRKRMDAEGTDDFPFPKGSMFWAKAEALVPLKQLDLQPELFAEEAAQLDGTMAHAVERIFGLSAIKAGFRCEESAEFLP